MKKLLNKLKEFLNSILSEEEESVEDININEVVYASVELHPLANEYAIPDEYLPETLYVIKYYKGTELIGMEPYSERKIKRLQKYMPVVWRVKKTLPDRFMMENVIRFEM